MTDETKKCKCQICHSYLFEDDDTVICPECGAPHHRDCWQTIGHCGLEDTHGTDLQYDKQVKKEQERNKATEAEHIGRKCGFCGRTSKTEGADFCPYCGQPYDNKGVHFQPPFIVGGNAINIDPYGGVPKDTNIEGVTAEDIKTFTNSNSARYVNKFKTLNKGNKNSWNWLAFLFPSAWCLSRKMYANGILLLIVSIASSLCFVPFTQTLGSLGDISQMASDQMAKLLLDNIGAFSLLTWIMYAVGLLLFIGQHILLGLRGDWIYRNFAIAKIKSIRANDEVEDYKEALTRAGSVSFILIIVAFLVENYLPSILASILW